MGFSTDEVAGVADLFGALPRPALQRGLVEVAFRQGTDLSEADAEALVDGALATFALVPVDGDPPLLAPGPAAFPELPEGAEDLPHLLDAERREVDRERVATAAEARFRAAVREALGGRADPGERSDAAPDAEPDGDATDGAASSPAAGGSVGADARTVERLLEVSYDLEAWAAVDVSDCRERLDRHL